MSSESSEETTNNSCFSPELLPGLLNDLNEVRNFKTDDPIILIINRQKEIALKVLIETINGLSGIKRKDES